MTTELTMLAWTLVLAVVQILWADVARTGPVRAEVEHRGAGRGDAAPEAAWARACFALRPTSSRPCPCSPPPS